MMHNVLVPAVVSCRSYLDFRNCELEEGRNGERELSFLRDDTDADDSVRF